MKATHRAAAAAAAAAALCMHTKLTSRLLRRHVNHRTYFYTGTKKKELPSHKKKTPSGGIRATYPEVRGTASYLLPIFISCVPRPKLGCIYTYEYTRGKLILTKKRKQHPSQGGHASTAGVAPGRFGRDEHGEARPANTTPNGGPHLELGYLRLKTWSKSHFSIAET